LTLVEKEFDPQEPILLTNAFSIPNDKRSKSAFVKTFGHVKLATSASQSGLEFQSRGLIPERTETTFGKWVHELGTKDAFNYSFHWFFFDPV
jgi:hypothetical protein